MIIPDITPEDDNLTAAIEYAKAGLYILPVKKREKHPGSVVGKRWQTQSSKDIEQIVAWFTGTDYGIAIHCGRSGLVVLDVDHPELKPEGMYKHLNVAPYQSTRDVQTDPGRGHYIFRQPEGRNLGNSNGSLGGEWGEVRGHNGVIIASPSEHADPHGEYRWIRTGSIPVLPPDIADQIPDAEPADTAASDGQVTAFLAAHVAAERPTTLAGLTRALASHFEQGSRHNGMVSVLAGAMKEAAAGYYPARDAVQVLRSMFVTAATRAPTGGERQRTEREAIGEFNGILAWAVGQANTADMDAVRKRMSEKMPTPTTLGTVTNIADARSNTAPAAAPRVNAPAPGTNGILQYTDAWNAERLINAREFNLHYIPERGRKGWITWNGTHWRHESDSGAAQYAAFEVIRDWVTIAGDDDAYKFKKKSLNAKGIGDMVKVAQQSPRMRVSEKSMDAQPYSLNTPDGIIDLKTGELHPHDPTEWHSRIAGCGYNPDAADSDCPKWIAFLHTTFGGDQRVIHYIQRLLGYALVGEVTEHILPFFWGPKGFNGKSCLLNLMQAIMGTYAEVASGNFLLQGHKPHEEEIASMHGARIVICSEINEGSKFDEARTKQFTGGDNIQGRHLYGSTFVFSPSHTLFVMGNERPHVPVGGNSFFRRFKLIGFDHQVPEQDRVQRYEDVLLAEEGPAILAWMVRGVIDMLTNGIQTPDGVKAATDEFAAEEDAVGQFISQCTMPGDHDDYVTCGDLYAEYTKWCKNNGEDAKPSKTFMQDVYQRGYTKSRVSHNTVRVVRGLKLLASPPPYAPQFTWNS